MQVATSYFGNRIVRHVETDVRRLRTQGFDILVHTFSENDLRFYRETMKEIVKATHESGLEVWIDPWGVGGVFGGEAFSDAALRHRHWLQVDASGNQLPACCPSNPGFQAFIRHWIEAALETGADAVFWDEPHFYSNNKNEPLGCHCKYCRELAEQNQPAIGSFLREVCSRVKNAGSKNVVCVLPSSLQDQRTDWLQSVTNLGSTPFWSLHDADPEQYVTDVGAQVKQAASRAGIQTHLWIQGFRIPAGKEEEIQRSTVAAAKLGVDVIAIWGFDGCEAMSALACERPQIAWASFLAAIRALTSDEY